VILRRSSGGGDSLSGSWRRGILGVGTVAYIVFDLVLGSAFERRGYCKLDLGWRMILSQMMRATCKPCFMCHGECLRLSQILSLYAGSILIAIFCYPALILMYSSAFKQSSSENTSRLMTNCQYHSQLLEKNPNRHAVDPQINLL